MKLNLKVITPKKIVLEEQIVSLSAPTAEGEITILPNHTNLFTLLSEGIVKIKKENSEDLLAIGAGYLETDGKTLTVLVSKGYGQDEIDQELTQKAVTDARKIITRAQDQNERQQALVSLRRSLVDIKLLKKKKKQPPSL